MALKLERLGALYEERLNDPGKALALYGEWAELGTRRAAALRAQLRAAEKAGDALVAAEAALKLGTEIADLPPATRFAWCYRAGAIFEERAAADDEAVRAYEAALALDAASRPGAGGAGARPLPQRPARSAGGGAAAAGGRARPTRRAPARTRSRPRGSARSGWGASTRRWRRRRGRSATTLRTSRRSRSTRACSGAAAAVRSWPRRWGRWGRRRRIRRTRRPRTGCRPRSSNGSWDRGARRWRRSSAPSPPSPPGRGTSRCRAAAAIDIAHERLFQLVGRGAEVAAAQVGELGNGRRPNDIGRPLDLAWRLAEPEAAWRALRTALDAAPGRRRGAGRGGDAGDEAGPRSRRGAGARAAGGDGDGRRDRRRAAARRRHRARASGEPPARRADRDAAAAAPRGRDARDRRGARAAGAAGDADRRLAARDPRAPAAGRGRDGADDARDAAVGAGLRAPVRRRSGGSRRRLRARRSRRTRRSCPRCARWRGCATRAATRARRRSCTRARRG